jgi:signal transduction histidine kinase
MPHHTSDAKLARQGKLQGKRLIWTSLRLRLLLGTFFWIAASITLTGWGLGELFQQHVARQFHAELQTHLDQLTAQVDLDAQGRAVLKQSLSDPRFQRPYSGYYWQLDQAATRAVLRSRSLWDEMLSVPADQLSDGVVHHHLIDGPQQQRLAMAERTVRLDEQPLRLIVAADAALMDGPVARFRSALWLALAVLGGGLVLAAAVQVYVGLAPLRRLQSALSQIKHAETTQLEGRFPSEVMPLVEEFNSVLAQNAEVIQRARTQAGNLAHALKTPLTIMSNAAQAINAASVAEAHDSELAQLVNNQVSLARRQVDYHLARAQAAAAVRLPGARTAIKLVIEGLLRTMRHLHAERGLDLQLLELPDDLAFRGEEQDLQEMLGNLLDNACKWARSKVEVGAQANQGRLLIHIADDGPGVPAEQRERILQRGVRGDHGEQNLRADEQKPGSGLGLAIVADLAQLYGGELNLQESALGGLQATLSLPAAG